MLLIPKGEFFMGCEEELIEECDESEFPRHKVTLSSYWIDEFEVTNNQYADFLNKFSPTNKCFDAPCIDSSSSNINRRIKNIDGVWSADSAYLNRPVTFVTWYGAQAYCEALGKNLPTEAQFEKAAKGAAEHYVFPWRLMHSSWS